ncbi:GGDEF domain [Vibrio ishigakensis]|uniref:GGDEF domain n=1 Tax=Vibrio ishigakensis TaxID=1481914 RepID=A0A0B8PHX8_9VIBR|nr:GGDEF domain [Vibrio ishigakensis]
MVVFDEVHHCSGTNGDNANSWGQKIIKKIQNKARFTLSLSGTPWRSDSVPIVLANYCDHEGKLVVDYQYSLQQAVAEGVCRSPRIILVDSTNLTLSVDEKEESYSSIDNLLQESNTSYRCIVQNREAMEYILKLGCERLANIRRLNENAGGLVVASSLKHAAIVKQILVDNYNQSVVSVSYDNRDSHAEISRFRNSNTQWIVSIGMISEGTDIPRLQVCCHMSSIKTELYFRQVLGRILRVDNSIYQKAWMYTFAEERLTQSAENIAQDIPDVCSIVKVDQELEQIIPEQISEHSISETSSTFSFEEILRFGSEMECEQHSKVRGEGSQAILTELQLEEFKVRLIKTF